MRGSTFFVAFVALSGPFCAVAAAQSVWGVSGAVAGVQQMIGPPMGPCAYPNGPIVGGFGYAGGAGCGPIAGPFPNPGAIGDVALDRATNTLFITDGIRITQYTRAGAVISTFGQAVVPGPLTGLGWGDTPFGAALFITDGVFAAGIAPPPPPGCAAPGIVIPPFMVTLAGQATDIDYDPGTNSVFTSNANGLVANQTLAGAAGPFGVFAPGACFGAPLLGLAVDTASCGTLYVTDGMVLAHVMMGGGFAPSVFYCTVPCIAWAGVLPLSGLAFDAAPIGYGAGCAPGGAAPPVAIANDQATSPNPAFTFGVSGLAAGGNAFLLVGTAPACPAIPIGFGCVSRVMAIKSVHGPAVVPATGDLSFTVAIPPGIPCATNLFLQWVEALPGGGLATSQGLEMTFAQN